MLSGKPVRFVFAFLLLAFLASCSRDSSSDLGDRPVLRFAIAQNVSVADPRKAHTSPEFTVMKMVYEGLTRLNPEGEAELALATDVQLSADQKTYTFTLRDSVWTDGSPVTAVDFESSWKQMLKPDFPSSYAQLLYPIKGAAQAKRGAGSLNEVGIRAEGASKLVVELEHPTPYFLDLVALPIFFPIHKDLREQEGASKDLLRAITNGPYVLNSLVLNDHNGFVKNPSYWDADAVQDQIIHFYCLQENTELLMYEDGELDWAGSPLGTLPADALAALQSRRDFQTAETLGVGFVRVNTESTVLKNAKLRRALALAVDREALTQHVLQGGQDPAVGLVPSSIGVLEKPVIKDHAANDARRLFLEALSELRMRADDFPVLHLSYAQVLRSHQVAQALQQQWKAELGIDVQLKSLEKVVFFSHVRQGNYELALGDWFADYRDPLSFLNMFEDRGSVGNHTRWEHPDYQSLLLAANQETNSSRRRQVLGRAETLLLTEMPIIPLYSFRFLSLKAEDLHDVQVSDLGHLELKWAWKG